MSKRMLVNAAQAGEVRVAIVDDKTLEDLNIAVAGTEQIKGNIYKAKVMSVENSLQAAFIDYGAERNGFIALNDINKRYYSKRLKENTRGRDALRIQDAIKVGTEMLVQVYKEEIGQKGAAFTTDITLPGRYIVLMPFSGSGGISRKIQDDEARKELKDLVAKLEVPEEMGLIVRTAGMGRTRLELQHDFQNQMRLWDHIRAAYEEQVGPGLIYSEPDVVIRSVRDYFTDDIEEIVTDDSQVHEKVLAFFNHHMPDSAHKVKLYTGKMPIFSNFGLEKQLQNISIPKVILPSGGSIVINPTEALTSIDVNSGKSKNHRTQELMAFETNLEASEEIARQLRLRDLGGLVVVDFIDMSELKHRFEVEKALRRAMKMDKARVEIGRISRFGMLEMSRQRVKGRLMSSTHQLCPLCEGSGFVMTTEIQGMTMLRRIQELAVSAPKEALIRGRLPVSIALYLLNEKRAELAEFEEQFGVHIEILPDATVMGARDAIEVVNPERHDDLLVRHKDKLIRAMRTVRKVRPAAVVEAESPEEWANDSDEPVVAPKIVGYLPPEEFVQSAPEAVEVAEEAAVAADEAPEVELAAEDAETSSRRRRRRRRRSGRTVIEGSAESVDATPEAVDASAAIEVASEEATSEETPEILLENHIITSRRSRRARALSEQAAPSAAPVADVESSEISRRTASRLRSRLLPSSSEDASSEPELSAPLAESEAVSETPSEPKSQAARRRERRQRRAERLEARLLSAQEPVAAETVAVAEPSSPIDEVKPVSEILSVEQRREERRSRRSRRARQAEAFPTEEVRVDALEEQVQAAEMPEAHEAETVAAEEMMPAPAMHEVAQAETPVAETQDVSAEEMWSRRLRSATRRSVAKLHQSEAPKAEAAEKTEVVAEVAEEQTAMPSAHRVADKLRQRVALEASVQTQETAEKPVEAAPETTVAEEKRSRVARRSADRLRKALAAEETQPSSDESTSDSASAIEGSTNSTHVAEEAKAESVEANDTPVTAEKIPEKETAEIALAPEEKNSRSRSRRARQRRSSEESVVAEEKKPVSTFEPTVAEEEQLDSVLDFTIAEEKEQDSALKIGEAQTEKADSKAKVADVDEKKADSVKDAPVAESTKSLSRSARRARRAAEASTAAAAPAVEETLAVAETPAVAESTTAKDAPKKAATKAPRAKKTVSPVVPAPESEAATEEIVNAAAPEAKVETPIAAAQETEAVEISAEASPEVKAEPKSSARRVRRGKSAEAKIESTEAEAKPVEAKVESTEAEAKPVEAKVESTEAEAKPVEEKVESSKDGRKSPGSKKKSGNSDQKSEEVKTETADAKQESVVLEEKTADADRKPEEIKTEPAGADQKSEETKSSRSRRRSRAGQAKETSSDGAQAELVISSENLSSAEASATVENVSDDGQSAQRKRSSRKKTTPVVDAQSEKKNDAPTAENAESKSEEKPENAAETKKPRRTRARKTEKTSDEGKNEP